MRGWRTWGEVGSRSRFLTTSCLAIVNIVSQGGSGVVTARLPLPRPGHPANSRGANAEQMAPKREHRAPISQKTLGIRMARLRVTDRKLQDGKRELSIGYEMIGRHQSYDTTPKGG